MLGRIFSLNKRVIPFFLSFFDLFYFTSKQFFIHSSCLAFYAKRDAIYEEQKVGIALRQLPRFLELDLQAANVFRRNSFDAIG